MKSIRKSIAMELSLDAKRFQQEGGFTLSSFDINCTAVPAKYENLWKEIMIFGDKALLLGEQPRYTRYINAKQRYLELFPLVKDFSPQEWPSIYLVLAESLFWLGDLSMSYRFLSKLEEVLRDDVNLHSLLLLFEEILRVEEAEDESYHNTQGERSTFLFSSPMACPAEPILSERLHAANTRWNSMYRRDESAVEEFSRLVCISTNDLEGVFSIVGQSWPRLIRRGFCANSIDGISIHSRVKKKKQILRILDNTLKCLKRISDILDDSASFTTQFVKDIHRTLLFRDNFEEEEDEDIRVIQVIRTGEFRQVACLTLHNDGKDVVQFCHRNNIEGEMERFCEEARRITDDDSIDPFMKAAWIQWAFCRIHPFEDGNGRISRILASIPLCKHNLPVIVVTSEFKTDYFAVLHKADREGSLTPLAEFLFKSMERGIAYLETLPQTTSLSSGVSVPRLRRSSTGSSSSKGSSRESSP